MPIRLIDQVIGHFGNAHRMALALHVAPQTVYRWREQGWLPSKYAAAVAYHTYGEISEIEVLKDTEKRVKALKVHQNLQDEG